MLTLDSLIREIDVDLMKIDVEGAEYLICKSSRASAFARARYVLMEIHSRYGEPREIIRGLGALGLTLVEGTENQDGVCCFINTSRLVGGAVTSRAN